MDAISPFLKTVVASLVYSLLGVAVFALSFLIIKSVTPFSIRKEIEEDQNTALAIVIGSVILGIALIISAAIHG
jgi:putative membrane protein